MKRLLVLGVIATSAGAQTTQFDDGYTKVRDSTVAKREAVFADLAKTIKKERDSMPEVAPVVVDRSPGLSPVNATNAIAAAQAAIQGSVDGAEAGFSIAPLLLLGVQSNHQLTVGLGALKEGKTQLTLAYTYQDAPALRYGTLGISSCDFHPGALAHQIDALRSDVKAVCDGAIAKLTTKPSAPFTGQTQPEFDHELKRWQGAHEYCADPSKAPDVAVAILTIVDAVNDAKSRADALNQGPEGIVPAQASLRSNLEALSGFKFEKPADCITEKVIDGAYADYTWRQTRFKRGVSGVVEAFPRVWGFNPTPDTKLSQGDVSKASLRVEGTLDSRGFEAVLGFGVGGSREASTDPMYLVISPSFSVAVTVAGLGAPLTTKDLVTGEEHLNLVNGTDLPPRVLLGLDLSLDYACGKPAYQVTSIQAFNATAYAEFRFTEKLALRAGIPLQAQLQTENDDKKNPVKRDLQWSLPVFVSTALKL